MPTHVWTTAAPGDWYAEPEPLPRTITVMCQSCYRLNRVPEASSSALLACGRCGERFRVYNRQRAPWGSCVAGFFKDLFTNDATGRARWAIVMILATVAVIALLGCAWRCHSRHGQASTRLTWHGPTRATESVLRVEAGSGDQVVRQDLRGVLERNERAPMKLFTSSWLTMARNSDRLESLGVLPVSISLTLPKFWPTSTIYPRIDLLAPRPEAWRHKGDHEAFSRAYLGRLDQLGVDPILEALDAIREEYPNRDLAMCCYEPNVMDCHRNLVRQFWLEQTAEVIEESIAPAPRVNWR